MTPKEGTMTWPPDYYPGHYPYYPPPRRHARWGYAVLAILVAALATLAIVAVANHTQAPDPEHSYRVGHDEIGPAATWVILEHPENSSESACTLAIGAWMSDWDSGNGIHTHVEHSDPPPWWDVTMVERGCIDHIDGR